MRDHHHHDLHHDLLHVQYCNQDGKLEIHLFFFLLDQGVRFVGLTSTSSFISVVKEDPIFFYLLLVLAIKAEKRWWSVAAPGGSEMLIALK